ncbi:hypothetical protein K501DRAFT_289211 [Backusella circina FSU 941]|nr:hypothetical protein K501DRAFT_289211 [Backusella circina FSU 941]
MSNNNNNNNNKDYEVLRSRYLRFWVNVANDKPDSRFLMHGHGSVQGKLVGTDSENNRFRVDQLESPLGMYNKAVIRGTDMNVLEIKYKL